MSLNSQLTHTHPLDEKRALHVRFDMINVDIFVFTELFSHSLSECFIWLNIIHYLNVADIFNIQSKIQSISNATFYFLFSQSPNESQSGEPLAQSSPLNTVSNNNSYQNGSGLYQDLSNTPAESDINGDRGRQRKKRDFFGTLKRRLGRSKSRAKSSERSMIPIDADNPNGELRSVSADRITSGTLGNNIGGGITSNTSTGNYYLLFFVLFLIFYFFCTSN